MFNLSDDQHPEIVELLNHFVRNTYRSSAPNIYNKQVIINATNLLNRDFPFVNIDNSDGQLCDSYPDVIPFLINDSISVDEQKLADLLSKCKRARCRNRFIVPVLKLGDRLLCRSATLSGSVEMFYRNGLEYIFGSKSPQYLAGRSSQVVPDRDSFDNIRGADIQLLKFLGVTHIVDLMLENQKYKYGVKLTSSEKADREGRYAQFDLVCLPFPGVEHFSDWVDNGYIHSGLRFDWSQDFINAELRIPDNIVRKVEFSSPGELNESLSDWSSAYQSWETVKLTKAYLKLILKLFMEESNGILLHCISGWDRTPLFISLCRLSLWADGVVHKSLNAAEMLYFTIAYDWFLFSHDLADRGKQRQEIFRYCFSMLNYIEHDEFSVYNLQSENVDHSQSSSLRSSESFGGNISSDRNYSSRKERLMRLRTLFENAYATILINAAGNTEQKISNSNTGTNSPNNSQQPVSTSYSMSALSRWLGNLTNGVEES